MKFTSMLTLWNSRDWFWRLQNGLFCKMQGRCVYLL